MVQLSPPYESLVATVPVSIVVHDVGEHMLGIDKF